MSWNNYWFMVGLILLILAFLLPPAIVAGYAVSNNWPWWTGGLILVWAILLIPVFVLTLETYSERFMQ